MHLHTRLIAPFSMAVIAGLAVPAMASFHLMQVEQIIGGVGGDTTAQAVQLRMRSSFQNQLQNARLVVRNAAGASPIVICDMTTPIAQTAGGTRILIASPSFIARTTAVPANATANFTMTALIPASYLAAGRLTFEDDFGTIYWSVSWGGAGYTGSNTGSLANDSDGNFGTPVPLALPSTATSALRFGGAFSAASTTNAADYSVTAGAAVFNNSAGNSFTVNPPPPPSCAADFNHDGTLDPDDLADYIGAFFAAPPPTSADFNHDGVVDPDDLADFIGAFFNGCP